MISTMRRISSYVSVFLALILITESSSALGISGVSFADVEQGRNYTHAVTLVNSPRDFNNSFVVEIDGAIKDWIKVSPVEFDLAKGESKQISITLEVPKDARLGEIAGTITAIGKKTVPTNESGGGASVGYAVATKGNIYANVIKPGALASVEITNVEVPSNVAPGSVAKFTVTSKNNGNVATSANFKLDIKKDGEVIASLPGNPIDFALGEEKTIKLFWDTQGVTEGRYEAYIEATTIARGSEKTSSSIYKSVPVIVGESGVSNILISVAGIVILIAIIAIFLKRKK